MRVNKAFFWTFSLAISLLSCYLFHKSSIQLYSDGDYMRSLQLSPDADTPSLAIAGTLILTFAATVGHLLLLVTFIIIAFLKRKEITINKTDLFLIFKKMRLVNTILQLLTYLLTAYWLWNFVETTQVKFFGSLLWFTIVAILVTWTYMLWIINLVRRNPLSQHERTTEAF